MDYIEISSGISIRIDLIEAIVDNPDGMTCTVKVGLDTYQSTFPYNVLLDLVQRKEVQEKPERKEELNILKTLGSFAG
jgi:hypothetical protein